MQTTGRGFESRYLHPLARIAQLAERQFYILDVGGSNPSSRTMNSNIYNEASAMVRYGGKVYTRLSIPQAYVTARKEGKEVLILAPTDREAVELEAVIDRCVCFSEAITVRHRPFVLEFKNGGRLALRVCDFSGRGFKGVHPDVVMFSEDRFP